MGKEQKHKKTEINVNEIFKSGISVFIFQWCIKIISYYSKSVVENVYFEQAVLICSISVSAGALSSSSELNY